MKSPVQLRQKIRLKIEKFSEGQDFVAYVDGFPVYVPNAIAGEEVEVKILEVKRNYAKAQILEIISPHPARVEPPCTYFYKCGGCQWQYMDYPHQLDLKKKIIESELASYEELKSAQIRDVKGAEHIYHYRSKAQQPVVSVKGKAVTGFYFPGTHRLTWIDRCEVQTKLQDLVIRFVMRWLNLENILTYDERTHEGFIRYLFIRESLAMKEAMLIFVVQGRDAKPLKSLAEAVTKKFPQIVSVIQNINTEKTNVILGRENIVLKGQGFIIEKILGLRFRISPNSFFQIHTEQVEKLVEVVADYAGLSGKETVIDAYCGVGLIGIYLARAAGQVYGIESNPGAVEDAYANAEMNGSESIEFLAMDAAEGLRSLKEQGIEPQVIVLDPPRQGCSTEVLDSVCRFLPGKIIYVSCDPGTLARDMSYLVSRGYELKEITPVDLFPQTNHVEAVALLQKRQ